VRSLAEKQLICRICGAKVHEAKFCVNCGSLLSNDLSEIVADDYNRLKNINNDISRLKKLIIEKLPFQAEKLFLQFREEFMKLYQLYEKKLQRDYQKEEQEPPAYGMIECQICGTVVPEKRFCTKCGSLLFASAIDELTYELQVINQSKNLFSQFKGAMEQVTLEDPEEELIEIIENGLEQYVIRINRRLQALTKAQQEKAAATITTTAAAPAEGATAPPQVESRVVQQKAFERGLINNVFFYLAVILLSIGLTVTLYFAVKAQETVIKQVSVLYGTGGGIFIIGVIFGIIGRIAFHKAKTRVQYVNDKPVREDPTKTAKKIFPWRTLSTTLLFISFVVLFTSSIVGINGSTTRGLRLVFLMVGFALAFVALGLTILNDSELLFTVGIVMGTIFTSVDILWAESYTVLSGYPSFIAYLLIIIIATVVAIIWKKWTGMLFAFTLIPIFLVIPKVAVRVMHEGYILATIPIAAFLIVKFTGGKVKVVKKHALLAFAYFFPTITMIVNSSPQLQRTMDEIDWSAFHWSELIIFGLSIIGTGFALQFIMEKELGVKKRKHAYLIAGLSLYGLTAFIYSMYFINKLELNTTAEFLLFLVFFVFGILSSLKPLKEYSTFACPILAFLFAEMVATFLLIMSKPANTTTTILYFLTVLLYMVLLMVNLLVPAAFNKTLAIFIITACGALLNIIYMGAFERINEWYLFGALLALLVVNLLINLPITIIGEKGELWRIKAIVGSVASLGVIWVFLLMGKLALFSYEAFAIFCIYVVAQIPVFITLPRTKKKEGVVSD